jgi:NDP-sugar pyrophosphorylase family protein
MRTKALVLAGGFGTRLLPAISDVYNTMAPVNGKPFLEYLLMSLRHDGLTDIVLCIGYLSDTITAYFGDGSGFGLNISYSVENEPMGTGGAIKLAEHLIDDTFLLLNGDTYLELSYRDMLDFHSNKGADVTVALTKVPDCSRYGLIETDGGGRITRFTEKSGIGQARKTIINGGVYVVEPSILEFIVSGEAVSFEQEILPRIIASGGNVYGFPTDGHFIDIGTPHDYDKAQKYLLKEGL